MEDRDDNYGEKADRKGGSVQAWIEDRAPLLAGLGILFVAVGVLIVVSVIRP